MSKVVSKPVRRSTTFFLRGLPLLAVSLGATEAFGQSSGAAVSGQLDPVTVTAERREENIKDVPSSISTVSGEKLDVLNSEGQDIRFLSGRVPSLNIESSFGRAFPRFYIRGYGNTDFHLNASQPVSLIYDDVVQENPILKGFPIFDTDQIEVLAGPQGTLFGRNTPAGVVKIDSAKPTDRLEGYFNVGWARFNTQNYEGAINVPISPELSARLSLQSQHRDDYVANEGPNPPSKLEGYDDNAARVQLLYKPNADFSALLNVHDRSLDGTARLFRANIIKPGTNDFVNNFNPRQVTFDGDNAQKLESNGASVHLRWNLGPIALNSISGYEHVSSFSRGDIDGGVGAGSPTFPPTGLGAILFSDETSDALQGHEQLTQEFRVESTGSGPLKYQGGFYFFHEDYGIDSLTYDTIGHSAPTSVKTFQTNNAWAAFGSVNYQVLDALNLRAGIRYTQDRKFLYTTADTAIDTRGGTTGGTHDSKVNWDASATYKVTPDVNVYGRVATGFRGSSIFPAGPFGPQTSAGPETNTSFELGAKADLFDKRARASFAVFDYLVDNQQLSAVGGQFNSTALLSAKHAVGRGVEFNVDSYLTPAFLVTLNGSYNYTKIKDGSLVVSGCAICTVTNTPGTVAGTYHIDGNPLPQAPKYIGNVTARYSIPGYAGGEYFVYTDWTYRSKVNFFLYESPEFTGKAMLIGGLRAGYDWNNGKYELAAFGRNITNTVRIVGGIDFNNLTGFINEPRIVGAQFKAQF